MLDTATYLPKLKEFEGVVPFMYLDTAGNVTVGVGNLLANAAAAQALAFVRRPDANGKAPVPAVPATLAEIESGFDSIGRQTPGKLASYYRQFTNLDLPMSAIDALLMTRVQEFAGLLRITFPDFDAYPAEACAAIFDMAFNLGAGKLTSQFPGLCRAIGNEDWGKAAAECHRFGPGPARNNWTKAQFQAAAIAANEPAPAVR